MHVEHCLDSAGINWGNVGPNSGLAKFIAGVNNALKHPDYAHRADRNGYPSHIAIHATQILATVAVRAQILTNLGELRDASERPSEPESLREARDFFERNDLTVDETGSLRTGR